MAGAGGGVDTGLDLDLFPAIRRQAAVGQWSPEERGPLLQTADGRTVAAVVRFTVSPPEASGVSSTQGITQTPRLPAIPAALQVTVADVVAGPRVHQTVSAADGSVVSLVETLALAGLSPAQLLTADVPPTKRVFTWVPRRPLRPHAVHWTVDISYTDAGSTSFSRTRAAAMLSDRGVATPYGQLKPHPTRDGTGSEWRPRPPTSIHWAVRDVVAGLYLVVVSIATSAGRGS